VEKARRNQVGQRSSDGGRKERESTKVEISTAAEHRTLERFCRGQVEEVISGGGGP
jgi:hypothetical protein